MVADTNHTRTSCERPNPWPLAKQTAVYLDADIITRISDVVKRWSSQTMLDGIHAHHQDIHENIWPEGFAIVL